MDNAEYVSSVCISGGLAIWWNKEINLTTLGMDRNMIDCKVVNVSTGSEFYVTWVYGDPDLSRRSRN